MTYFSTILRNNNLPNHDGRTLWKYNFEQQDYNNLKRELLQTPNLQNIDAKDCALYYALWWQYGYNGGRAGKDDVFNSFNDITNTHNFNEEEFYQKAKQGGRQLGFYWIKHSNTLYFRTLLLQGGAPKTYCQQHGGIYTNLLLNISDTNPATIYDINPTCLNHLPKSLAENNDFLEFCIEICSNPDEFLEFIPDNQTLGQIRANRQQRTVTRTNFQSNWFLNTENQSIILEIESPKTIEQNAMQQILNLGEGDALEPKYSLSVNEDYLCDYIQLNNGNFKRSSYRKKTWAFQQNHLFNIEMIGNNGTVYNCPQIVRQYPNIEEPSLWAKISEHKYKLEKGHNTAKEEALVLYPSQQTEENTFTYNEQTLAYAIFNHSYSLLFHNEELSFKTNYLPFKCEMSYQNPSWVKRSSIPMVTSNPIFEVYNTNNNTLNATIEYKATNQPVWTEYQNQRTKLPLGLINFKLTVNGNSQIEQVFHTERLHCRQSSNNIRHSAFQFSNRDFDIQFYPNELFEGTVHENLLALNLSENKIPSSIKFRIKHPNQRKSVLFYMDSNFNGVELTNNNGEIIDKTETLYLNKLKGLRLFTDSINQYNFRLHNESQPELVRRIAIQQSVTRLHAFEDTFQNLFALTSPIARNNTIIINVEQKQGDSYCIVKKFQLKQFSHQLDCQNKNTLLGKNLRAIPLNCAVEFIQPNKINTESIETLLHSLNEVPVTKFIVYEKQNGKVCTHTEFLDTEVYEDNVEIEVEDSYTRVARYANELATSTPDAEIWKKILVHYHICLNEGLPFSTFEPLRALLNQPELIAKCFFFLAINNHEEQFTPTLWKQLETEIGFSALWINTNHWDTAINWILEFYNEQTLLRILFEKFTETFSTYPEYKSYNYTKESFEIEAFHINTEINNLRQNLGIRALEELPQNTRPPVNNRDILTVNEHNYQVKILLKAPVAIAESMAGTSTQLWGYNIQKDAIRRTILYCQQIQTERTDIDGNNFTYSVTNWFQKAILFAISSTINH